MIRWKYSIVLARWRPHLSKRAHRGLERDLDGFVDFGPIGVDSLTIGTNKDPGSPSDPDSELSAIIRAIERHAPDGRLLVAVPFGWPDPSVGDGALYHAQDCQCAEVSAHNDTNAYGCCDMGARHLLARLKAGQSAIYDGERSEKELRDLLRWLPWRPVEPHGYR